MSTLAQAQRAVAASGSDRLLGTVSNLVAIWPEMKHKIDAMQVVDDYAKMYGVNPKIVRDDDAAQESMAIEQQAAQAAAAAEAAPKLAAGAKVVSDIDPQNMTDVMGSLMGYNTPTPGAPL